MSLHTCEHINEKLFTSNTEEETFHECDVSKQRFLAEHQRTDSNNKRYEYEVCSKSFARSNHLLAHERTHNIDNNDKPYECDVCEKRFSTSGNLSRHKRTHTGDKPYECDVCNKRFPHQAIY